MCGNHRHDGTPVDHHHDRPIFRPEVRGPRQWRRRAFLGELGRGSVAVAVLAPAFVVACSREGEPASTPGDPTTTSSGGGAPRTLTWARADLGFVSAYVLARGREAVVVDTGVAGSADDIGRTLADLGLTYADVRRVVLTHLHGDHAGSIGEVMAMAGGATAHAGEADIGGIDFDPVVAVRDGDEIFGLEVIATPGHTAGHISVIDHAAGLLVAGDAINTLDGGVQGPNPAFSTDLEAANQSARRLAELSFNTLLAGHGDPIEDRADTAVAAMAAAL